MTGRWDRERLRALVRSEVRYLPLETITWLLASVPAGPLVDLILDGSEFSYRRAICARALAGRMPPEHAAALADCGRDETVPCEVRNPVLISVLSMPDEAQCADLLPWLEAREVVDRRGGNYSLDPSILLARAMSGDGGAVKALALRAADQFWAVRTDAEQAVEALIRSRGYAAVLSAFGCDSINALALHGRSPAERLLGLRCLYRAGGDIAACLADKCTLVARKAYDLLTESEDEEQSLLTMVGERRPGHLWALAILHERGHDIRPMWEALGSPQVELPGVPPDVREAIVRQYTPGQRDTDPRWLVEAALLEYSPPSDASLPSESLPFEVLYELNEERLELATRALAAAGLEPQEPLSACEVYGTGDGSYHLIPTEVSRVEVSTLGPFFASAESMPEHAKTAMREAGFRYIGSDLGEIEFAGLHVYYFGRCEPLKVRVLLFYWQD